MKYLVENQLELMKSIEFIKTKIIDSKPVKHNPYNLTKSISDILLSKNPDLQKLSQNIRYFHDFYGWKAWGGSERLGLCAGALYRTSSFLEIHPEHKSGSKNPITNQNRIHIEHTFPINQIKAVILRNIENVQSLRDMFNMILNYSVCTAFTKEEETYGIKSKFKNDLAESNLTDRKFIFPLQRYLDHVIVVDLFSSKIVAKNTSLEELTQYYKEIDIYNWSFIESRYK